jgi:MFS family permease
MTTEPATTDDAGDSAGRIFTAIWAGQLLSSAGSSAASLALALAVYSATDSALALALLTAAATMSTIYLSPLAGAVSDRYPRRRVLLLANLASAGTAGLLAVAATWESDSPARLTSIVALVFVSGALNALLWVTMAATVRLLRPEANLTRVNGITTLVESVPTVAGPILGAVPLLWMLCAILRNTTAQLMNAPLTAIWQERIPRESQATIFGARRLLGQGLYPIAVLLGGFLADHVLTAEAGFGNGDIIVLLLTGAGEIALAIGLSTTPALRKLAVAPEHRAYRPRPENYV